MPLNQLTTEGEFQHRSGNAMRGSIAGPRKKTDKEPSLLRIRDADASVMNVYLDALDLFKLGHGDVYRATLRRVCDSIANQIQQHLPQWVTTSWHPDRIAVSHQPERML